MCNCLLTGCLRLAEGGGAEWVAWRAWRGWWVGVVARGGGLIVAWHVWCGDGEGHMPACLCASAQAAHDCSKGRPYGFHAHITFCVYCCCCSVAAGALYPAYATYKSLVVPKRAAAGAAGHSSSSAASVHSLVGERWLKYWALFGLTVVAERLLDSHLDRWV